MNREELKAILPHREPMLLLDEVILAENGDAEGKLTITGDEYFVQGHFPGSPVVPGVILCEVLAQTCCVLLGSSCADQGLTPYFTGLDNVKFRRPVRPGDTLCTTCRITRQSGQFYFAEGEGKLEGKIAVSAKFSFALVDTNKSTGQ